MNTPTNLSTYQPIDINKPFPSNYSLLTHAFTLAEVLITLGIIGVVAAMTIPTLMSNFAKQKLEEQIKVTYSSIQQTMKYMDYEDLGMMQQ